MRSSPSAFRPHTAAYKHDNPEDDDDDDDNDDDDDDDDVDEVEDVDEREDGDYYHRGGETKGHWPDGENRGRAHRGDDDDDEDEVAAAKRQADAEDTALLDSLGPLASEEWIINLGERGAHDLSTVPDNTKVRLRKRLSNASPARPWRSLPDRVSTPLSRVSAAFAVPAAFDQPAHNELQNRVVLDLTRVIDHHARLMDRALFFDFCQNFLRTIYPLLCRFEAYCALAGAVGNKDPRMLVQMAIVLLYESYTQALSPYLRQHESRDGFLSEFDFQDVVLPYRRTRGVAPRVPSPSGDMSPTGSPSPTSMRGGGAGKDSGGGSGSGNGGGGIAGGKSPGSPGSNGRGSTTGDGSSPDSVRDGRESPDYMLGVSGHGRSLDDDALDGRCFVVVVVGFFPPLRAPLCFCFPLLRPLTLLNPLCTRMHAHRP